MNSKTNSNSRVNNPSSSTPATQSPYNLRRKSGAVVKRSNTTKLRKNISSITAQTLNQYPSPSTSQKAQDPPELPLNNEESEDSDDEESDGMDGYQNEERSEEIDDMQDSSDEPAVEENGSASSMERSDDEEALAFQRHNERGKKKPVSVRSQFEFLYDNLYLCTICSKVCVYTKRNLDP